jgi:hypothetical protein
VSTDVLLGVEPLDSDRLPMPLELVGAED